MVGVNCRNATTVFHWMTISLQRCIEVTTHNLHVTGRDVGYQRRDAVVIIDGFSCTGQRDRGSRRVSEYDMQTSIAHIKAGYRNSVSDELESRSHGEHRDFRTKPIPPTPGAEGAPRRIFHPFGKLRWKSTSDLDLLCSCTTNTSIFKSAASFFEFESSEICS